MTDPTTPAVPEPVEPAAAPPVTSQPYTAPPTNYAPAAPWNVLSIVSLVAGILGGFGLVAVITGHIALSQIKKRAEGGRGLAIAGLIIGYLGCLGWIIFWVSIIGLSIWGASAGSYYDYSY